MRFHCRLRTCQDAVAQAHGALRCVGTPNTTMQMCDDLVSGGTARLLQLGKSACHLKAPPSSASSCLGRSRPHKTTQCACWTRARGQAGLCSGFEHCGRVSRGSWTGLWMQSRAMLSFASIPCMPLHRYGASFVGMLEAEADGVGVWSTPDMTAVVNVTNATMRPFVDLAEGKYGQRVTQPGHFLLAINCQWTSSKCVVVEGLFVWRGAHTHFCVVRDVGQLWDMQLRRRAAALVDDTAPPWKTLYALQPVYTSRGRCGIVYTAFPGRWQLFGVAEDYVAGGPVEAAGRELLSSDVEIQRSDIIDALRQQRSSS